MKFLPRALLAGVAGALVAALIGVGVVVAQSGQSYSYGQQVDVTSGYFKGRVGTVDSLRVKVGDRVYTLGFSQVKPHQTAPPPTTTPTTTPPDTTPPDTTPTTPPDTTPTTPPDNPPPVTGDRPFSDDSPFNTPVGSNPTVLSNSASLVASSGMSGGLPSPISTDRQESVNYDHPTYYPKSSDPMATITFRNSGASYRVPVPNYAIPAGASDHHICIVYGGWEYNLWNATKSGSAGNYTFSAQIGGRMPADGPGIMTPQQVSQYGSSFYGGVEAKFSERAGMITAAEMQAGQINHALFVVASGSAAGTSGAVYPGYNNPSYASNDRVRMGTRFWLDMSDAAIDATSAPRWEKIIAHAAHQYGIYVGDKGGAGFSFMLESSTPYNAAKVANPWDTYWPSQGVRNSGQYGYAASFTSRAIWSNLKAIAPPSPQIP